MSTLERAIEIATEAHRGQFDKAGNDYIGHPLRVMESGKTLDEKIVGVLHDVIEDTNWTFEQLENEGFSNEVMDALRCVTKISDDEPYDKFIARIKANPLAVAVKLNDLSDNMDIRRLPYLSDKDVKRLKKYLKAYKQLAGEPLHLGNRTELRLWLEENHTKEKCCWVVTYRGKCQPEWPAIPYIEVVEEALCFGGIDSTLKRLPDGRLVQRLSPRRPKSHWTQLNMERCRNLEDRGLMTDAGRRAFESSLQASE